MKDRSERKKQITEQLSKLITRLSSPFSEEDIANGWNERTRKRWIKFLVQVASDFREKQPGKRWQQDLLQTTQEKMAGIRGGALHDELVAVISDVAKYQPSEVVKINKNELKVEIIARLDYIVERLSSPLSEEDIVYGWEKSSQRTWLDNITCIRDGFTGKRACSKPLWDIARGLDYAGIRGGSLFSEIVGTARDIEEFEASGCTSSLVVLFILLLTVAAIIFFVRRNG